MTLFNLNTSEEVPLPNTVRLGVKTLAYKFEENTIAFVTQLFKKKKKRLLSLRPQMKNKHFRIFSISLISTELFLDRLP